MAKLGVNVDHVATLRQARLTSYPDPVTAAKIALSHGVSCITVHLREDRRHIQDDDLYRIRKLPNCRLNMEMAAEEEIIKIALDLKPDQVTLVPEKREELTTEGGLDVGRNFDHIRDTAKRFNESGISASLFIDADSSQIEASSLTQAVAVELNTGPYSQAKSEKEASKKLREVKEAAAFASGLGLTVHAGHGLTYKNVMYISDIPHINEINIGHSIVSQALFVGFDQAVSMMSGIIAKQPVSF